jgi:uncharacterized membrane protein YfcA
MDLSREFYLIAALIVFFTGISKSGFAAGIGAMGVPILSLFVSPSVAAGVLLPTLVLADLTNLWNYRNHWDKRYVVLFVPGALVGISLGTMTFTVVNPDGVRLMVGLFAMWFSIMYWGRAFIPAIGFELGAKTAFVFGAISGFTSHIAHAGGPPVRAYLMSKELNKSAFVGTLGVFFCIVNLIKLIPYVAFGQGYRMKKSFAVASFTVS